MARHSGHDERREAFTAAAARVLARDGFPGLTVRNVAREARSSLGALVHYFPSKKQLFLAACDYAVQIVVPRLEEDEHTFAGVELLRRVLYEMLPTTKETRQIWAVWLVFWDRAKSDPEIGELAHERYRQRQIRFERLIQRAKDEGALDASIDVGSTAQFATILVDGIGIQALRTNANLTAKRQTAIVDGWIELLPRPAVRKRRAST